ncbi:hypothetical protein I6E11_00580 [Bacteroides caecigallinarum]|uniref:hypothetical protein n=1 Tax=Bacteroides caecigallinarum TaxID=1411144 RepID=UPI001F3B4398|nr:hypothetical protein [Bacteroides caecigallinarum]MCF2592332.1 hypothetical protein [Bacteroides caecigallinarum]
MRTKDFIFILIVIAVFLPFIISDTLYDWYLTFNAEHGMVMSFLKFSILATMGELLGLRISKGVYYFDGFGVLPRAIVWGILGMGINMAFIVFSTGVPAFMGYMGMDNPTDVMAGALTPEKVLLAFSISVVMNSIFAPVFMTLHKITDTHIMNNGGTLRGLFTPIKMGEIMQNLNWKVQWGFVFKKTIPLFWFPAHTVTFLLPGEMRVLFAALLGVLLGVILSVAARKK